MPRTPAPSVEWGQCATFDTVRDLPSEDGIWGGAIGKLRPFGFVVPAVGGVRMLAITDAGTTVKAPIEAIPLGLKTFDTNRPALPDGIDVSLRHRKGGQAWHSGPEGFLRLLRLQSAGLEPTEVYHGMHPDHPGQRGFYLHVRHIGKAGLDLSDPEYLPLDQVRRKFFPIGPAALRLVETR